MAKKANSGEAANEVPAKTQFERVISAVEWVCLAGMVAPLVMRMTANALPPPWVFLISAIAMGTYLVLFCIEWLEWKRGNSQESNPA